MKQHKSIGKQVRALDKEILSGTVIAEIELIKFTDLQKAMKAFEQQIKRNKNYHQIVVSIKI